MTRPRPSSGWRTSATGSLRFNRDFTRIGVGRITNSARTTSREEFSRRDAVLSKLADASQLDVLRAFKDGRISIEELVAADRENRSRGPDLLAELRVRANLWDAVGATMPRLGTSPNTRKRYEVSLKALRERGPRILGEHATVSDLSRVDWSALRREWDRSPADWNHLRRAISVFLSTLLGDKFHPVRRAVMSGFPKAREVYRVPDITPATFRRIFDKAAEHVRPALVVLALTGMRVGEYLRCTREHLQPESCRIQVPGTKTDRSATTITVPEEFWPWIEAGVPSPLKYKWLRIFFKRACEAAKVPDARLHDLRHCFAQWGVNAGVPEAKVQAALRHTNPFQTRRYSEQRDTGDATKAVGDALRRVLG